MLGFRNFLFVWGLFLLALVAFPFDAEACGGNARARLAQRLQSRRAIVAVMSTSCSSAPAASAGTHTPANPFKGGPVAWIDCPHCSGRGVMPDASKDYGWRICRVCDGRGKVAVKIGAGKN